MAFSVVVRPLALRDIDDTPLHIASRSNPGQAGRWRESVFDRTDELADAPTSFAAAPEATELRQAHLYAHRIVFRVDDEAQTTEVLRIYHGVRQAIDLGDLPGQA